MELVEGESLDRILERERRLTEPRVVAVARDVAKALAHADDDDEDVAYRIGESCIVQGALRHAGSSRQVDHRPLDGELQEEGHGGEEHGEA